jgi:hypothetical protein
VSVPSTVGRRGGDRQRPSRTSPLRMRSRDGPFSLRPTWCDRGSSRTPQGGSRPRQRGPPRVAYGALVRRNWPSGGGGRRGIRARDIVRRRRVRPDDDRRLDGRVAKRSHGNLGVRRADRLRLVADRCGLGGRGGDRRRGRRGVRLSRFDHRNRGGRSGGRRHGGEGRRPRREEGDRVEIAVVVARHADAEMHVRHVQLGGSRRSHEADGRPLLHTLARPHR